VSAADAREELEAEVWRAIAIDPNRASTITCTARVDAVLAAAGRYAEAIAHEAMDVHEGRERLEQATAERTGRAG